MTEEEAQIMNNLMQQYPWLKQMKMEDQTALMLLGFVFDTLFEFLTRDQVDALMSKAASRLVDSTGTEQGEKDTFVRELLYEHFRMGDSIAMSCEEADMLLESLKTCKPHN